VCWLRDGIADRFLSLPLGPTIKAPLSVPPSSLPLGIVAVTSQSAAPQPLFLFCQRRGLFLPLPSGRLLTFSVPSPFPHSHLFLSLLVPAVGQMKVYRLLVSNTDQRPNPVRIRDRILGLSFFPTRKRFPSCLLSTIQPGVVARRPEYVFPTEGRGRIFLERDRVPPPLRPPKRREHARSFLPSKRISPCLRVFGGGWNRISVSS